MTVINALAHAEALLRVKMSEADLIEAFAAGAIDYLIAPLHAVPLQASDREWLRRRRLPCKVRLNFHGPSRPQCVDGEA